VRRKVHKPFLLRVSRGVWAARSEITEVFFEEEEGCLSESLMVLLGNWSVCVGVSSPISSMNLDEFHNSKSLDAPPPTKAISQQTLSSSPL
jgi:hypothetical protein